MSISSIVTSALSGIDWFAEAEKATTDSDSLLPLLVKTAIDGYNAARGNGSILTVIGDVENDINTYTQKFNANQPQPNTAPPAQNALPV